MVLHVLVWKWKWKSCMVLVWKVGGCSCMVLHGSGVESRRVSAWFWCGE